MKLVLSLFLLLQFYNVRADYNNDNIFKLPGEYVVELQYFDYHLQLLELRANDFEILGVNFKKKTIDLFVNDYELNLIKQKGYDFIVKDTKSFVLAPDREYKNPQEIEEFLTEIHDQYPNLTKLVKIGSSVEGRDIWAIKISDNPEIDESNEPTILFNSMHHAREVMTPEVGIDIVEYLVKNYGHDDRATHWVDSNEIWVVPMLNVDGNHKVWNGYSMWRKNVQGGYGVDINRNYPYKWGSCNGSSGSRRSSTYRGPTPGSEPETKALMNLVSATKPVFSISYHSYSELVLYPYGCYGDKTRTHEIVSKIGKQIGKVLDYRPGTPWEILYGVDGGDIDWMYAVEQVIPYVIELNSSNEGFQPDYNQWRDKTVERNRAGWQFLLDRLDGSGVRGTLKDSNGTQLKDFRVEVYKKSVNALNLIQTYRSNPDGTFHIILNKGNYTLKLKTESRSDLSIDTIIRDQRENIEAQL